MGLIPDPAALSPPGLTESEDPMVSGTKVQEADGFMDHPASMTGGTSFQAEEAVYTKAGDGTGTKCSGMVGGFVQLYEGKGCKFWEHLDSGDGNGDKNVPTGHGWPELSVGQRSVAFVPAVSRKQICLHQRTQTFQTQEATPNPTLSIMGPFQCPS